MRSNLTRWGSLLLVLGTSLGFAAPSHATPSNPNDQLFPLQWNLQMIGAPSAWQVATGSGVTIAIVDSGVDLTHEDLKGDDMQPKIVGHVNCIGAGAVGHSCIDTGDAGQDDNGHGSHVAGIAAASTDNNSIGVAGVAPDAKILAVKVLDDQGNGAGSDVAAGIVYAADHGAKVINLSLGNPEQSVFGTSLQDALTYAFDKGAVPVIAAGNNFVLPSGPIKDAIVVGALNRQGIKATYSNIGSSDWAIMAPGGDFGESTESCQSAPVSVLSTYFKKDAVNSYACLAGTSMAAPHVAGAAAILLGAGVNLSAQQTVDKLLKTARILSTTAADGVGALDVAAAVGRPPTVPSDTTPSEQTTVPTDPSASGGSAGGAIGGQSTESTPAGDLGGPNPTSPPVITPPNQRAGAATPGRVTARSKSNDDPSPAVVGAAVLMASSVGCAVGWFALRGSHLARRTPRIDRLP